MIAPDWFQKHLTYAVRVSFKGKDILTNTEMWNWCFFHVGKHRIDFDSYTDFETGDAVYAFAYKEHALQFMLRYA